jgi:hypothetical protein
VSSNSKSGLKQAAYELLSLCKLAYPKSAFLRKVLSETSNHWNYSPYLLVMLVTMFLQQILALSWSAETVLANSLTLLIYPLLSFCFWLLLIYTVATPLVNVMMRISISDEVELHWWPFQLEKIRKAILSSFTFTLVAQFLLGQLLGFLLGKSIMMMIAALWGSYILMRMLRAQWNFNTPVSGAITIVPLTIFAGAALLLSFGGLQLAVIALLMILFLPVAFSDFRLRLLANKMAERLSKASDSTPEQVLDLLEIAHQAGGSEPLKKLAAISNVLPAWLEVRILNGQLKFLEALDLGIEAMQEGEDSAELHLAMAEASFGAYEAENAVAHAEEALEKSVGTATDNGAEAALFLALAHFNECEFSSGEAVLGRLLAMSTGRKSRKRKRILKESKQLALMATQLMEGVD